MSLYFDCLHQTFKFDFLQHTPVTGIVGKLIYMSYLLVLNTMYTIPYKHSLLKII